MTVDPSLYKIWVTWLDIGEHLPMWDPYGSAMTLILVGFASGQFVRNLWGK